jgi:prolyl 4-hydroxylase
MLRSIKRAACPAPQRWHNPHMVRDLAYATELAATGREGEAYEVIAALAARHDPDAMFALADMHWRGGPVPLDHARGRALFAEASEAGHPVARRATTNLMASGIAGGRDWPGALARLRDEAREDTRRARMLTLIERMELDAEGNPSETPQGRRAIDAPEVIAFPKLFTFAECDFLIEVAGPSFEPTMVVDPKLGDVRDKVRTSDGATFHWLIEDPLTHALNRRLAAASGTRHDQGEPLLILRYRPGQEYLPHLDALPGIENQRIKTALVYLNHGYEGGETAFTKVDRQVAGTKGDCIVFRNTRDDGRPDPMSEHAGRPVTKGVKYLASRWIHERRHAA